MLFIDLKGLIISGANAIHERGTRTCPSVPLYPPPTY